MNNIKKSFILNVIIVILEIFAIIWMVSGIRILDSDGPLTSSKIEMLKFFTVDSNILMAIISFLFAIGQYRILNNKIKVLPTVYYRLKLVGTVSVTLTMLVTLLFLAPKYGFDVFYDSNLFLHIINPLLCIISFILYEKSDCLKFRVNILSLIPITLYALYYIIGVLFHINNGVIDVGYDWYGFFIFGIKSIFIIPPIMFIFSYIISIILWKLNKVKTK